MASYYDNAAYDFETFAPRRKEETGVVKPDLKIVRAPKKSRAQVKKEKKAYKFNFARIISAAVAVFILLSAHLYLNVVLTEKTRELDNYNSQIKVAQSENVALNDKLYEIMSLDTVEKKAVKELHMVKRDSSQIRYVEVGDTDNFTDGVRTDG